MRTSPDATRADIEAWRIDNIRLTAFTSTGLGKFDADWFAGLVSNEEIRSVEDRKLGIKQLTTDYDGGTLTLSLGPGVFNLIYSSFEMFNDVVTFKTTPVVMKAFDSISRRALAELEGVQRLAIGSTFLLAVDSREDGYSKVSSYLPFDVDAKTSHDFAYQINRKRNYEAWSAGLVINRLARWSVARVMGLQFQQSGTLNIPVSPFFCRVELDVNTDPESSASLPKEALTEVFEKMLDWSIEIIREGDIE